MITVQSLSKHYGRTLAVDDLSFTVPSGHVTGFLGPNGAGKSTTMRLMLGLAQGGGQTLFDDLLFGQLAEPLRTVGSLLEAKSFHPKRTALDHLRMVAAAADIPRTRIQEVLEEVGLANVAHRRAGEFSLGMAQRLGLATAVLAEPKYLLLDEPANGLDPEGIVWLRTFLKKYAAHDRGILVSSHLLAEIAQLADHVVVIGRGRLIKEAPVDEFINDSGKGGVFVRSDQSSLLAAALSQHGATVVDDSGGLLVQGLALDQIGDIAFGGGYRIYELTKRSATLEEAFLEVTAGREEFKGKRS